MRHHGVVTRGIGTHNVAIVVAHHDCDSVSVILHVFGRTSRDDVPDNVATGGGKSQRVVVDGPLDDLVAVCCSSRFGAIALGRTLKVDLMRVFAVVRVSTIGLDGHGVLGLVDRYLAVFVSILAEVNTSRVSDGDGLAFAHGCEGVVEAIACAVVGIATAVARNTHVVVEDEGIASDNVLHVDVGHIARRRHRNGVVERARRLIKGGCLVGIGLGRLRLVKDDVTFDELIEMNVRFRAIELGVVGKTEADVCRLFEAMIVGVAPIEFDSKLAVRIKMKRRIYLIGSVLIDDVDL